MQRVQETGVDGQAGACQVEYGAAPEWATRPGHGNGVQMGSSSSEEVCDE